MEIVEIKDKGRGLCSTESHPAGVSIGPFFPTAACVNSDDAEFTCAHCFDHTGTKLLKCSACKDVYYCDRNCQKGDWYIHKFECKALQDLPNYTPIKPNANYRLIARCVWSCKKKLPSSQFELISSFDDLVSNLDMMSEGKREEVSNYLLILRRTYVGEKFFASNFSCDSDILNLLARVIVNSFGICDESRESLGYGLYLTPSLFNHSCDPNVIFVFNGKELSIRTLKPISKGEEFLISYVHSLDKKSIRLDSLRDNYMFTCQCSECISGDREKYLLSVKCANTKCKEIIMTDKSEGEVKCDQCDSNLNLDVMYAGINSRIEKCQNVNDYCKALKVIEKQIPDENITTFNLLSDICDYLYSNERHEEVLPYEVRRVACWSCYYPYYHPHKSSQIEKVAMLYTALGNKDRAKQLTEDALRNLLVTHGEESKSCIMMYEALKRF